MENITAPTPRAAGTSLLLATLGMLAWLVLSLVFADVGWAQELRRIDRLWGWVAVALFQLLLLPENEHPALRITTLVTIAVGIAVSIAHGCVEPGNDLPHLLIFRLIQLGDAVLLTLAVIASCLRGIGHLSGRAVKASDVWMFTAMQWLLVWAAADLVLTWRNPLEPSQNMRLRLAEMAIFGAGVHAALGLALTHLRGPAATIRDRAALVALAFYNAGLVALLFDLQWIGAIAIFLGALLFLLGSATLLRGDERLIPLLLMLACVFVMAAALMRPFDNALFAGWRHAAAGGCVGLAAVAALGASAAHKIPPQHRATGIVAAGAILFVLGVGVRLGVEMSEMGVSAMALYGSLLEMLGLLLLTIAAVRGRAIRKRLNV